jgi:hypothetical protein
MTTVTVQAMVSSIPSDPPCLGLAHMFDAWKYGTYVDGCVICAGIARDDIEVHPDSCGQSLLTLNKASTQSASTGRCPQTIPLSSVARDREGATKFVTVTLDVSVFICSIILGRFSSTL